MGRGIAAHGGEHGAHPEADRDSSQEVEGEDRCQNHHVLLLRHQLPVRIHFVIVMIRWTGLAPFPVPCSLTSEEEEGEDREEHHHVVLLRHQLPVRIHFIIVMIRSTGLAPWEFEFPFPGSLTSTFLAGDADRNGFDTPAETPPRACRYPLPTYLQQNFGTQ